MARPLFVIVLAVVLLSAGSGSAERLVFPIDRSGPGGGAGADRGEGPAQAPTANLETRASHLERLRQARDRALMERDAARAHLKVQSTLARHMRQWLRNMAEEKTALVRDLALLQDRLSVTRSERQRLRRQQQELARRVRAFEFELAQVRLQQDRHARHVAHWVEGRLAAVEGLLGDTGLDARRLLERLDGRAQGGPLEALDAEPGGGLPADEDLYRLERAQRLLASLPLAPPLAAAQRSSGFGARRDPITGKRAMHHGLDFRAAEGAIVRSPAAGRVTYAGRNGAYGIMVEIDHGIGVTTRYGHLAKARVEAGQHVPIRAALGEVGSTGRSTGPHLHYEVRVDNIPLDPEPLLRAGQRLAAIFER